MPKFVATEPKYISFLNESINGRMNFLRKFEMIFAFVDRSLILPKVVMILTKNILGISMMSAAANLSDSISSFDAALNRVFPEIWFPNCFQVYAIPLILLSGVLIMCFQLYFIIA